MEDKKNITNNQHFMDVLENLKNETIPLATVLDNCSDNIRTLESSLIKSKTNFCHINNIYEENGVCWFFSWEPCPLGKRYRLFLISEEKETGTMTFRKPLIECKLEVRLKVSQYLIPFMNTFKDALKQYRLSLNKD